MLIQDSILKKKPLKKEKNLVTLETNLKHKSKLKRWISPKNLHNNRPIKSKENNRNLQKSSKFGLGNSVTMNLKKINIKMDKSQNMLRKATMKIRVKTIQKRKSMLEWTNWLKVNVNLSKNLLKNLNLKNKLSMKKISLNKIADFIINLEYDYYCISINIF